MSFLGTTKRSIATSAAAKCANAGLISPNLRMGATTLPRDLRAVARSTSLHLERHVAGPSLSASSRNAAPQISFASQQTRGFHMSPRARYDSSSYTAVGVPSFFVKYKERCATSFSGSEEELGLMPSVTHSVRLGDVIASTRRLKAKIPVEHQAAGGHIVHPSGFVVPGPGHTSTSDVARAKERARNENLDRAMQTAAVAHRVLESDFEQVDATTLPLSHKVPFEVSELDGTVKHPSGFIPPTPAVKFRYIGNMNFFAGRKVSTPRPKVRYPSPARPVLRAMHTETSKALGDC